MMQITACTVENLLFMASKVDLRVVSIIAPFLLCRYVHVQ